MAISLGRLTQHFQTNPYCLLLFVGQTHAHFLGWVPMLDGKLYHLHLSDSNPDVWWEHPSFDNERNGSFILVKLPIGSMYGIYANIGGILMVNVTIYTIHGSYGLWKHYIIFVKSHSVNPRLINPDWLGGTPHMVTICYSNGTLRFFTAGSISPGMMFFTIFWT